MKKLCLILSTSVVFFSCNSDQEDININQGLNFEEISEIKKKGFNFKKNNYNFKSSSRDSDLHKGCTAPCCAE